MPLRASARHRVPIGRRPEGGGIDLRDLRGEQQEEDLWCWAACVEMLLKHFGVSNDRQCQIAQKGLRFLRGLSITCCTGNKTSNDNASCDVALEDGEITKLWESHDIPVEFKRRGLILSPSSLDKLIKELKGLLDDGHPVELGYRHVPNGHVVVLYGWERDASGELRFLFQDPETETNASVDALDITRPGFGELNSTWTISEPG